MLKILSFMKLQSGMGSPSTGRLKFAMQNATAHTSSISTCTIHHIVTHHFSGPGRAICSVCVRTITFEVNDLDIWHAGSSSNYLGQGGR